jgi:hypothetical protein
MPHITIVMIVHRIRSDRVRTARVARALRRGKTPVVVVVAAIGHLLLMFA